MSPSHQVANLNPRLSAAEATEKKASSGVKHCCHQTVLDKVGVQDWGTPLRVRQVTAATAGADMYGRRARGTGVLESRGRGIPRYKGGPRQDRKTGSGWVRRNLLPDPGSQLGLGKQEGLLQH